MEKEILKLEIIKNKRNQENRNLGKKLAGLFFIFLGMILTLGDVRMTGAIVGGESFFSWIGMFGLMSFLIGGVIILIGERNIGGIEKIAGREYALPHSLQRMKQRGFTPTIIDSVMCHGKKYKLASAHNFGPEARGATQVYISKHIAKITPKENEKKRTHMQNMAERFANYGNQIKSRSKKKNIYESLLVLTDDQEVIKTVYVASDKSLRRFYKNILKKT
jgi:hypothetical protein